METSEDKFTMTEPVEIAHNQFAFWFMCAQADLLDFVGTLACVSRLEPLDDGLAALVLLDNEFDPDEAWHWVRTELEEEINTVRLDSIWHDAVKWIL